MKKVAFVFPLLTSIINSAHADRLMSFWISLFLEKQLGRTILILYPLTHLLISFIRLLGSRKLPFVSSSESGPPQENVLTTAFSISTLFQWHKKGSPVFGTSCISFLFKDYFTHSCEMLDHASFLRIPRLVGILIHCSGGRFLIFFGANISWTVLLTKLFRYTFSITCTPFSIDLGSGDADPSSYLYYKPQAVTKQTIQLLLSPCRLAKICEHSLNKRYIFLNNVQQFTAYLLKKIMENCRKSLNLLETNAKGLYFWMKNRFTLLFLKF